jgi:hypothetical protein
LLAITGLATLVTTPFSLAEMRGYTNSFIANLEKYQLSTGTTSSDLPWLSNFQVLWNDSAAATLLMGGGLILAVFRHTRRDVLLLTFPLVYLLSINGLRLVYPRNVLPLTYYGVIMAGLFSSFALDRILDFGFWILDFRNRQLSSKESLEAKSKIQNPKAKNYPTGQLFLGESLEPKSKIQNPKSKIIYPFGLLLLVGLVMYAPLRNSLYGGWFNNQPFSYQRVGEWLESNAGPGPLKLAELRPQQWRKGYPNLFAVRDDPKKAGNQADAHSLDYYRERGIAYLAINDDRARPFLESGQGNYPDLFANGKVLEKIETRTVEKPGPSFTILSTGVTPETLRLQHPLPTEFGTTLHLLGFNLGKVKTENEIYLPPEGIIKGDWPIFKPGEIVGLSIYWQPLAQLKQDYTVFLHLQPVARPDFNAAARDTPPLLGVYPTSQWKPGEIITDNPNLALPAELAPGDYTLMMGLYAFNSDGSLVPFPLITGATSVNLGTLRIQ